MKRILGLLLSACLATLTPLVSSENLAPQYPVGTIALWKIPGALYNGRKIVVRATSSTDSDEVAVNLQTGTSTYGTDDVAIHVKASFNANVIVRATYLAGRGWLTEETDGGLPFRRGDEFELEVLCAGDRFTISINGSPFCSYNYRFPITRITHLSVTAGLAVKNVQFDDDLYYAIVKKVY
ncbi:galectin-5-like [Venturia canescens]|uniref:galectin-5-like n=1 Tax=Venturia canescens TaxID=32260 RepID=UPI001C9D3A10|nr:galectin-5-like [Venturia canescens]